MSRRFQFSLRRAFAILTALSITFWLSGHDLPLLLMATAWLATSGSVVWYAFKKAGE